MDLVYVAALIAAALAGAACRLAGALEALGRAW